MSGHGKLLSGLLAGAGAMYLLDPDRGARRRSLLRDKGVHASHALREGLGTAARDVRNRSTGAAAAVSSRFRRDEAGDEVVNERVRTALGRSVSHPGAINTAVYDGRVFLSGPVLASEVDGLLASVRAVRGVHDVENQLQVHERGDDVPGLQGSGHRVNGRAGLRREVWDPTTRLAVGGAGGAAILRGLRSGGFFGGALATLGAGLLARAATNLSTRRLLGIGEERAAVRTRKAITVAAPVERVWALWSNFENFPRFMSHLRQVRRVDDRRSLWTAAGPAGTTVQWDAEITDSVPGELIAWRSVEGAPIATSGVVRFRPAADGGTEIDVQLDYTPPAGAVGHAVAILFGVDPKHSMDDDMLRLKSLLEEGKTSRAGAREQVRLEDIEDSKDLERPW
jgi:uncharacterized membrane protein